MRIIISLGMTERGGGGPKRSISLPSILELTESLKKITSGFKMLIYLGPLLTKILLEFRVQDLR